MFRWFRAFLPREERFFDLFARHAAVLGQGALALQDMLKGGDETPVYCQRVNQFENDADGITREVLTAVRRTFITPFDRGDIKNLITAMDDAIDQMQQIAKAVLLFEVREFEPLMREMGALLVECADLVGRALPLLQSIGQNVSLITAITEELTKLEGRVDDLAVEQQRRGERVREDAGERLQVGLRPDRLAAHPEPARDGCEVRVGELRPVMRLSGEVEQVALGRFERRPAHHREAVGVEAAPPPARGHCDRPPRRAAQ